MRQSTTFLLAAVLVLAGVGTALGGAMVTGFNASYLGRNDDNSTGLVSFGFTTNFYGNSYTGAYLNNNGNLTFGSSQSMYTPHGLGAGYVGQAIIAPFFADVDTRPAGSGVMEYGAGSFNGHTAFGVTWDGVGVGYYSNGVDKLNKFQTLLVDRSDVGTGDFDIVFNYDQIQWETGSASGGSGGLGGTSAAAGYSKGTAVAGTYYELPGSLVNGALLDSGPNSLVGHTNAGLAGRYIFSVRNGEVTPPPPVGEVPEPTTLVLWSGLGAVGAVMAWRRKRQAA